MNDKFERGLKVFWTCQEAEGLKQREGGKRFKSQN